MNIKVLLVDDEKKFVMMLAKRLTLRGIDAHYVHDARSALSKVEREHYHVVVLDVKMPGMGGIELRRALLKLEPDMKVIFLTGHGSKDDFEAGIAEGAEYLTKPLRIEVLVEKLHQLTNS